MITCPHCKAPYRPTYRDSKLYYYCYACGNPSKLDGNALFKLDDKEEEIAFEEDNDCYLPTLKKVDIRFNIHLDYNDGYDFFHSERYLTLLFHTCGIVPKFGDTVEGISKNKMTEYFTIIETSWGIDEYRECYLNVIPQSKFLKQFES